MAQYLKPDSELGYLQDNAEIESLKFNNVRHTVLGCMLGDFDEVGSYVVEPEIKKELIEIEKYVVQTYDNIELCKSVLKLDKQISFMVAFEGNKATLTLVEKMNYEANFSLNSGTYSNINEYVLDSVETSGEINRNIIYQRWNIKAVPGNIIDIFNCDAETLQKYFGIVKRLKKLLVANKKLLEEEERLEEVEAEYATSVMDILKHYPKLEKPVIDFVANTLKQKQEAISIKKPFFAKTFNEILENAIMQNLGVLDEKEKADYLGEKRNATINLNVKRSEILEIEHEQVDENQPSVVSLKVSNATLARPVQELADEFAWQYKQVEDSRNGMGVDLFKRTLERNGEISATVERDKLIEILVLKGLGDSIGFQKEKVASKEEKKEVRTASVAPAPQTAPANKAPIKKAGGEANAKGPAKSAPSGAKGNALTKKPKKEETQKKTKTSSAETNNITEENNYNLSDMISEPLTKSQTNGAIGVRVKTERDKQRDLATAMNAINRTEGTINRTNNAIETVKGVSKDTDALKNAVDDTDNIESTLGAS